MQVDRSVAALTGIVYFIQGALGLSAVAFPLFLRNEGLDVKEIALIASLTNIPWLFKILYAATSDSFPLWGYHRKTYIALCSVCSVVGWFLLGMLPFLLPATIGLMLLANFGFAATDVVTDGLVVEHSDEKTAQTYQSLSWGARSIGAIVSGAAGGWLATRLGYRPVFLLTSALPLLAIIVALRIHEHKTLRPQPAGNFLLQLLAPILQSLNMILRGNMKWFCLLLILGTASTSFSIPLFFYFKETLGFHETLLGILSSLSWVGAVLGCMVYYQFMKKMDLKKALYLAVGLDVLGTISCLLIFNCASAISLCLINGVMGYLSLLPLMSYAARTAHRTGVEGSLFAILMSVRNLGVILFTSSGGYLHEIMSIRQLILISTALASLGLWVIARLEQVSHEAV